MIVSPWQAVPMHAMSLTAGKSGISSKEGDITRSGGSGSGPVSVLRSIRPSDTAFCMFDLIDLIYSYTEAGVAHADLLSSYM
jgi:hypothetical protein